MAYLKLTEGIEISGTQNSEIDYLFKLKLTFYHRGYYQRFAWRSFIAHWFHIPLLMKTLNSQKMFMFTI